MLKILPITSLLLIWTALLIQVCYCKYLYISSVFRHGARYPVHDYYDYNETKHFSGLLTSVGLR